MIVGMGAALIYQNLFTRHSYYHEYRHKGGSPNTPICNFFDLNKNTTIKSSDVESISQCLMRNDYGVKEINYNNQLQYKISGIDEEPNSEDSKVFTNYEFIKKYNTYELMNLNVITSCFSKNLKTSESYSYNNGESFDTFHNCMSEIMKPDVFMRIKFSTDHNPKENLYLCNDNTGNPSDIIESSLNPQL